MNALTAKDHQICPSKYGCCEKKLATSTSTETDWPGYLPGSL